MSMCKTILVQIKNLFITDFSLLELTLQIGIFGFQNVIPNTYFVLFYHMYVIFKKSIHQLRETCVLCYETLMLQVIKIKKTEKQLNTSIEKLLHTKRNGKQQ